MNKLKVGDRVRVVKCMSHGSLCNKINKEFIIESINIESTYPYRLKGCNESFNDEELELVIKTITKSELKGGDIITYGNGDKAVVDIHNEKTVHLNDLRSCYMNFSSYNEDLFPEHVGNKTSYNMVEVYRPTTKEIFTPKYLIPENKKEMTITEIEKALGYEIKVIKENN